MRESPAASLQAQKLVHAKQGLTVWKYLADKFVSYKNFLANKLTQSWQQFEAINPGLSPIIVYHQIDQSPQDMIF